MTRGRETGLCVAIGAVIGLAYLAFDAEPATHACGHILSFPWPALPSMDPLKAASLGRETAAQEICRGKNGVLFFSGRDNQVLRCWKESRQWGAEDVLFEVGVP